MLVGATSMYSGSWLEGVGCGVRREPGAALAGRPRRAAGRSRRRVRPGRHDRQPLGAGRRPRVGAAPPRRAPGPVGGLHHRRDALLGQARAARGDGRRRRRGAGRRARPAGRRRRCARPSTRSTDEVRDGIFAVVATAGTTNLGIVDDIAGHRRGGPGARLVAARRRRVRRRRAGRAERGRTCSPASSTPTRSSSTRTSGCSRRSTRARCIYRDPVQARAAHTQHASYLDPVNVEGEWNPSDFAIQLTRRARGLPFWFSLAVHGTDAYTDAIEQTLTVTRAGRRADPRRRARAAAGRARPVGAGLRADRLGRRRLRALEQSRCSTSSSASSRPPSTPAGSAPASPSSTR